MSNRVSTKVDKVFFLAYMVYNRRSLAGEVVDLEEVWRQMGGVGDMPAVDAVFAMGVLTMPEEMREEMEESMWESIRLEQTENKGVPPLPDHWRPGIKEEMGVYLRSRETMN